jgi:hypothetical protein
MSNKSKSILGLATHSLITVKHESVLIWLAVCTVRLLHQQWIAMMMSRLNGGRTIVSLQPIFSAWNRCDGTSNTKVDSCLAVQFSSVHPYAL